MTQDHPTVGFGDFIRSVSDASFQDYKARPTALVESEAAFDEIRHHILEHYAGVYIPHSFVERGGQIVDCMPIEQQPALKGPNGRRMEIANDYVELPHFERRPIDPGISGSPLAVAPQLSPAYRDHLGNQMWCPEGTVPTVRVTLEQITRFRNLQHFQQGLPDEDAGQALAAPAEQMRATWAFQDGITVQGGRSAINVWQPGLRTGETLSASLQKFEGQTGDGQRQYISAGMYVFPQLYNSPSTILTIFYKSGTRSAWNRSDNTFVQTDPNWIVGGASTQVSSLGGTQYVIELSFFCKFGRWTLFINGQPIGYYPVSAFAGGDLTTRATSLTFGGVVQGAGSMPRMGSGEFANNGLGRAAFQSRIQWFTSSPGGDVAGDANLSLTQPVPRCYTISGVNSAGGDWGTYDFFGGPGGTNCN